MSTETIESPVEEKKKSKREGVVRFDPFENPGPIAEQEAGYLNNKYPGLGIEAKHVRAVISSHSEFQKSDYRKEAKAAEDESRAQARQDRINRHEERKAAMAEKREERARNRAQRESQKAKREAARAAKAAEKAARQEAGIEAATEAAAGPKKVRKPKVKPPTEPEGEEDF